RASAGWSRFRPALLLDDGTGPVVRSHRCRPRARARLSPPGSRSPRPSAPAGRRRRGPRRACCRGRWPDPSATASRAPSTLGLLTRYASVYPLVTARALAREFTYEVPDEIGPGAVVEVRFGNARRRGVVTEVDIVPPEGIKTAAVERVVEELPPALFRLALWVADYYGSTPGGALGLVAPVQRKARGERPQPADRDALAGEPEPAALSSSQRAALDRIVAHLDAGKSANYLLYGATGSGKTEVYLQACAAALDRGRGAIVLVPEIALTPQALARFRASFGERIAVLHSALNDAERRDAGARIARGGKAILLLTRRGVAPALHCRACGTTLRCENCDVALVLHADRVLRCHHCGYTEREPETCPACGPAEIVRLGAGTQRLERELEAKLP